MKNRDQELDQMMDKIIESVNQVIDIKIKNMNYLQLETGKITQVYSHNIYVVSINELEQNIFSLNNATYNIGDIVLVLNIHNDKSQKYILGNKPAFMI